MNFFCPFKEFMLVTMVYIYIELFIVVFRKEKKKAAIMGHLHLKDLYLRDNNYINNYYICQLYFNIIFKR